MDSLEEKSETCLNRFLGRCIGCAEDYDQKHHPNNYDCPDYKPIKIGIILVEK